MQEDGGSKKDGQFGPLESAISPGFALGPAHILETDGCLVFVNDVRTEFIIFHGPRSRR